MAGLRTVGALVDYTLQNQGEARGDEPLLTF